MYQLFLALLITFILFSDYVAALVKKCITAIQNLIVRDKVSGVAPLQENIVVVILNVGTFRAADIKIMNE